jgi:hypothetical protein
VTNVAPPASSWSVPASRHRAGRELAAKDAAAARQHSCRALGMCEHDAEAACTQLGGAIDKSVQSIERRLEQPPAPAGRADGDLVQLGLRERPHHLHIQLAARQHGERDAFDPKPVERAVTNRVSVVYI